MEHTGDRDDPRVATRPQPNSREPRTTRLTTGQAIVRFLSVQYSERDGERRRVIPATFGIFGHGNVCGLGQALDEYSEDMKLLQGKNEQAMVHAAIGYAKAENRLSTLACAASIGPGATNLVTGAATATVNRIPVLLLPGDTFASRLQGPPMQALDDCSVGDLTVNDCLRPVSRFFDRITRPEQLLTALPGAIRTLLDPEQTGAATICLHQDVQAEAYDFPSEFFRERTWHVTRRPPDQSEVRRVAQLIATSERPLIIAGGGVHYSAATDALCQFADEMRIPVAETSAGKGAGAHCELTVGAIGHSGTRAANELAREADVIISIGTRLIDLTTGSNSLFEHPEVRFVGLNLSSADALKLGGVPLVADAREGIEALLDALHGLGWQAPSTWAQRRDDAMTRWRQVLSEDLAEDPSRPMSQQQAIAVLNEQCRTEDSLVVASGTPHVDIHKLWDSAVGGRVYMEVGFSCMGHEIPAGIGARLGGGSEGEVYVLIGDGTYLMGHTELVTALQEGLKVTVLVIENHGFQSIHALQRRKTGRSFALEFRRRAEDGLTGEYLRVDLAANAASYGCATFEVNTQSELREALIEARAGDRASVIVVHVDPTRLSVDSQCWWDVGVAEVSQISETRHAREVSERGRTGQRFFG